MNTALTIRNLSVAYEDRLVLDSLDLEVRGGELVCVCGESGCGKTSLLNAIMGFTDHEGEILFNGTRLTEDTIGELRKNVVYIPQELNLPIDTVAEMVHLPFTLKANRHIRFDRQRLMADWEILGLEPELYERRVAEISGGQRQRMMVSVAGMLHKPLILVDEPTSALDIKSADNVLAYFRKLCTEEDVAVLAISHHRNFAVGCDRRAELAGNR